MEVVKSLQGKLHLNNGVEMPQFGLGVYLSHPGEETYCAVLTALEAGYRHIDTATLYGNEEDVGRAVRDSGLPREEIFITTKVWNDAQGYRSCQQAIEQSLALLQSEWIDLYLIHWPIKSQLAETWQAMTEAYQQGQLRAIGVSNFHIHHLQELSASSVVPAVNQVECHIELQQEALRSFCHSQGTVLEAWRPLLAGRVTTIPILQQLAQKYDKTAVQVSLRWLLQRGIVVIPKSVNKERIISNAKVFDFTLTEEEMAVLAAVDRGHREGKDPDEFVYLD